MYSLGQGVVTDKSKAFYWYTQAAQKNIATSQYNLGIAYYNGVGTPVNLTLAVNWIAKSQQHKAFREPNILWGI